MHANCIIIYQSSFEETDIVILYSNCNKKKKSKEVEGEMYYWVQDWLSLENIPLHNFLNSANVIYFHFNCIKFWTEKFNPEFLEWV